MRGIVKENRRDPRGLLVEFMNTHINNTIIITGGMSKTSPMISAEEPKSGLLIRSEIDRGIAYISRSAIRDWLIKGGSDYNWVSAHLRNQEFYWKITPVRFCQPTAGS